MDDNPACIDFLRTVDWVVAPYETIGASALISADRAVVFDKVAELPPVETQWRGLGSSAEGYSFVLFRRVKAP